MQALVVAIIIVRDPVDNPLHQFGKICVSQFTQRQPSNCLQQSSILQAVVMPIVQGQKFHNQNAKRFFISPNIKWTSWELTSQIKLAQTATLRLVDQESSTFSLYTCGRTFPITMNQWYEFLAQFSAWNKEGKKKEKAFKYRLSLCF